MREISRRIRVGAAAVATAAVVGVLGVGAISPQTAQAAGVVVERVQAVPHGVPARDD